MLQTSAQTHYALSTYGGVGYNKSVKCQVKINDIIRYMDANNLVHMKDKLIYYTIAVQTKVRRTMI